MHKVLLHITTSEAVLFHLQGLLMLQSTRLHPLVFLCLKLLAAALPKVALPVNGTRSGDPPTPDVSALALLVQALPAPALPKAALPLPEQQLRHQCFAARPAASSDANAVVAAEAEAGAAADVEADVAAADGCWRPENILAGRCRDKGILPECNGSLGQSARHRTLAAHLHSMSISVWGTNWLVTALLLLGYLLDTAACTCCNGKLL